MVFKAFKLATISVDFAYLQWGQAFGSYNVSMKSTIKVLTLHSRVWGSIKKLNYFSNLQIWESSFKILIILFFVRVFHFLYFQLKHFPLGVFSFWSSFHVCSLICKSKLTCLTFIQVFICFTLISLRLIVLMFLHCSFFQLLSLSMEPLQPPQNFKFHCIYSQNKPTSITSFNSNQPPNLVPSPNPLSNVNLWIFVEKTKRKWMEYE